MPSFETLNELIKGFVEYENYDLQEYIGVCLVRLAKRIDKTEWIIKEGVEGVKKQTLVGKRNWGVWLYKLVEKYGNTLESVKQEYIWLQKIFFKFLFDRKSEMQDISSKALSLLYKQGTKETKDHLVENLSKAFAGETVEDAEMGEKDEDQEDFMKHIAAKRNNF